MSLEIADGRACGSPSTAVCDVSSPDASPGRTSEKTRKAACFTCSNANPMNWYFGSCQDPPSGVVVHLREPGAPTRVTGKDAAGRESEARAPRRGRTPRVPRAIRPAIARAGVRTGVEQPHGSRAKRPMTRGTRSHKGATGELGRPCRLADGPRTAARVTGEAPDDPWHPEPQGCHGRARSPVPPFRTVTQPHGSSGEAPDDPWHPERIRPRTPDSRHQDGSARDPHRCRRACHQPRVGRPEAR